MRESSNGLGLIVRALLDERLVPNADAVRVRRYRPEADVVRDRAGCVWVALTVCV